MLKINLLPVRQLKKRVQARKQILLLCCGVALSLVLFLFIGMHQSNKIEDLNNSIARLEKAEKSYYPILKRIKDLKKTKIELERKTEVIKKLQKDSSLTVRVLDEVANAVGVEKIWLKSLNQKGGMLQLSGIALDNRTISDFMDVLKESPYVIQVNLTDTSLETVSGRNLKKFSLNCKVASPTKKEESQKS